MSKIECCQATPHGTLLEQIMNSSIPKNEREWAAKREIERLLTALAEKEKECELITAHYREFIQKVLDNKYEPDKLLILCGNAIKQALEGEKGHETP